jgi:CRP/FNR family cyclic AMP-dependent transcriptional regulator
MTTGPETSINLQPFPGLEGVEVIQRTAIFRSLGFDETLALMAVVRRERRAKGDVIIEQNGLGQALYVVRSGEVGVYREDEKHGRRFIRTLKAGDHFGEMSIVDDLLTSAEVVVTSDEADLLVIPREDLDRLLGANDHLAARVYRAFCKTLTARLRGADAQLDEATPASR